MPLLGLLGDVQRHSVLKCFSPDEAFNEMLKLPKELWLVLLPSLCMHQALFYLSPAKVLFLSASVARAV